MLLPIAAIPTVAQEDDAAALLTAAAEATAAVQAFHFELSTPRGQTQFAENVTLLSLIGDVQRPDRFQAVAVVDATIAQMELTMIGIGTTIWVSDPLSAEPAFIEIEFGDDLSGEGASLADLMNPDRLLLAAVGAVEEPVSAGQDEIDGVPTTRVNGIARFDELQEAGLTGTPIAGATILGEPLQVAIWIDEDYLVRQLDVYGPMLATEDPNTVRRLKLSAFDEPIDIQPPTPVAAAPGG
jgi:hypothetical protein